MAQRIGDRAEIVPALAEVFREHGFEGASLARISERTGLGKGSLYHFFPGGKEEMAAAVLGEVAHWFETHIFRPLREEKPPQHAIAMMLQEVDAYFRSGRRLCLVGVLALGDSRDLFAREISGYFTAWRQALATALQAAGHAPETAEALAEDAIAAIQGALILNRATPAGGAFARVLARLERRLLGPSKG